MSEISDEEVDYGSFDSIVNPATDSDRAWSPSIDQWNHKSKDNFEISSSARSTLFLLT